MMWLLGSGLICGFRGWVRFVVSGVWRERSGCLRGVGFSSIASRRALAGVFIDMLPAFGVTWLDISSSSSASMPTLAASSLERRRRDLSPRDPVGTFGLSWWRAFRADDLVFGVTCANTGGPCRSLCSPSAASVASGKSGSSGISLSEREEELCVTVLGGCNDVLARSSNTARGSLPALRFRGV